jgi:hypothetical protein
MQIDKPTDNVAILALMMAGVLTERLVELGQLDEATKRRLHHLVAAVRTHSHLSGGDELDDLFNQIEKKLDLASAPAA